MSAVGASIDLSEPLCSWVESASGRALRSATRHRVGASREAWNVEVDDGGRTRPLFLLRDKGGGGGSARDAAVLAALSGTAIPVPRVIGHDASLATILLERLPGRSDFPDVEDELERETTARHLMELTGALHRLDPGALRIEHLSRPDSAEACARAPLADARKAHAALADRADPLFAFALDWLDRNVPGTLERLALVHSDMGPGNFLFEAGRVTGIVDWEVAHFGDPMEDLAAIAVRDMATPVGPLPRRFAEYRAGGGLSVDLDRVGYYRILVLARNALMIGLGLAHPPAGFDVVEMTMYQTLLMRALALVLCDALGVERPEPPEVDPTRAGLARTPGPRAQLLAALQRDLRDGVAPGACDDEADHRVASMERALDTLAHEEAVGASLDRAEIEDLARTFDERPLDPAAGERVLVERVARLRPDDVPAERALAGLLARRMLRRAERLRPLMGRLFERLPQRLEEI